MGDSNITNERLFSPTPPPIPNEKKLEKINENEIDQKAKEILLDPTNSGLKEVSLKFLKVIFFPVALVFYGLSKYASNNALGTKSQLKVNQIRRDNLIDKYGGQEVKFGFRGGPLLEGMYFSPKTISDLPQKTILLCLGSHASYEYYAEPFIKNLMEMGHPVFTFNYEGFGNSQGEPSEEGVYQSTEAAYQYLVKEKNCQDSDLTAWGYSLGSGAATELATKHPIDVVMDRGFSSMDRVAQEAAPVGLQTMAKLVFICTAHFNNLSKQKNVKGNVFIAQGNNDERMIKELHGDLLKREVDKLAKPKHHYVVVDAKHEDTRFTTPWYSQRAEKEMLQLFLRSTKPIPPPA